MRKEELSTSSRQKDDDDGDGEKEEKKEKKERKGGGGLPEMNQSLLGEYFRARLPHTSTQRSLCIKCTRI